MPPPSPPPHAVSLVCFVSLTLSPRYFLTGMNSIVIYACHSIFASYAPVYWVMPDVSEHWQKLFITTWGTAVWIVVAYVMYRKKVFIAL